MNQQDIIKKLAEKVGTTARNIGIRENEIYRLPAADRRAAHIAEETLNARLKEAGIAPAAEVRGDSVLLDLRELGERKLEVLESVDLSSMNNQRNEGTYFDVGDRVQPTTSADSQRWQNAEAVGDMLLQGRVFLLPENRLGIETPSPFAAQEMVKIINGAAQEKAYGKLAYTDENILVLKESNMNGLLEVLDGNKGALQMKSQLLAGEEALAAELSEERSAGRAAYQVELREARRILQEGPPKGTRRR